MILGLVFGIAAATWAFSGMLSMDPFRPSRETAAEERVDAQIARSLRGQIQVNAFSLSRQKAALAQLESRGVKEFEYVSVAGNPAYVATLTDGSTRVGPLDSSAQRGFEQQEIADAVSTATADAGGADISVLSHYDMYYEDRRSRIESP